MRKTFKQILSLLLVAVMLFGSVPVGDVSFEAVASWDVINTNGVTGNDIVNQARKYLGVPYTSSTNHKTRTGYGTTMAFDCSGFAYRVCRDVGLTSSRANYSEGKDSNGNYYLTAHTQEQRYYGKDISNLVANINKGDCSGLQAGDLLFFTSDNANVSHVAIYSGNGTIIHSEGWEGCVAEHPVTRYPTSNNWYFAACRLVESNAIIKSTYPSHCTIKATKTTYVKSLPCSEDSDKNSKTLETASKDAEYTAIELVKNKYDNLWYKVKTKSGSTGYVFAGNTSYVSYSTDDIKGSGITVPTNHTAGKSYGLTGSVSSSYNKLTAVSVHIYKGTADSGTAETGTSASVSGNSYSFSGSTIDNKTVFNILPAGTHTYVVRAAFQNYYAKSGTALQEVTGAVKVYKATFNVVNGSSTPSESILACNDSAGINNKHFKNTESVTFSGWAFSNIGKEVSFKYILDSNAEVKSSNVNRGDVKNAYGSSCSFVNVGYSFKLDLAKLSIGKHTIKIIATSTSGKSVTVAELTFYVDAHTHTYGNWTTVTAATCVAAGSQKRTCSACGNTETKAIAAGGHKYGEWATVTSATCSAEGKQTRKCSLCGYVENKTIATLGHDYKTEDTPASCKQYAGKKFTCKRCGYTYTEEGKKTYSEWSTTYPENADKSLIESKTQYRYSDYQTQTSYDSSLSGYKLVKSEWVKEKTENKKFVSSWPSGYPSTSTFRDKYTGSRVESSENATTKVVAENPTVYGYIYYHYCRNTYANGPINRKTSKTKTSEFKKFHGFSSATNPNTLTAADDGSRTFPKADLCKDSHWYYPFEIYTQNYTTYKKLNTFERWTDFSAWSDTAVQSSNTRKVETRTIYRYVTSKLGNHVETVVPGKAATCTEKGLTEGKKCSVCGTVTVAQTETPATGHKEAVVSGKAATCTEKGMTEGKKCSVCGIVTVAQTEIPATGHKETVVPGKAATCTEKGLTEGKKCSACGTVTVAQTEIPVLSHKDENKDYKCDYGCGHNFEKPSEPTTQAPAKPEEPTTKPEDKPVVPEEPSTMPEESTTKPEDSPDKENTENTESEKKLGKVVGIKIKKTTVSSIQLSWKKVEGAEKYKIYYSKTGKTWKSKTTSKTTYTVKKLISGQSYQFKVKAIAGENEGAVSDIRKTATRVDEVILGSVKSSKASQAVVRWDRTDGANGYVIEYSTSKKFTKKTTKKVTIKKGKTTKTTLKKLKSGKKYYVRIRAFKTVNKKTVYGAYSSVKSVKIK